MQSQQNNPPIAPSPACNDGLGRVASRAGQMAGGRDALMQTRSFVNAQCYQGADAPRSPRCAPAPGSPGSVPRCSFTLIEILIAVSIIAILLIITLQVVGALLTQGRDSATKATISKIQSILNERAQAFD